jgi:hypothetical protein
MKSFLKGICCALNWNTMGIIRNALIGIALYEVVAYLLKKGSHDSIDSSKSLTGAFSGAQVPSINPLNAVSEERSKSDSSFGSIPSSGSNSSSGSESNSSSGLNANSNLDLAAGSNPDLPLSGDGSLDPPKDEWANSLANDELRAPDS